MTRRTMLTGAAGMAAGRALAQAAFPPPDIRRSAGYQGWARPQNAGSMPLDVEILLEDGQRPSLRQWMNGRPALLILWALWCTPCLAEKQPEDDLLRRLRAANSRTNVLALQSYDTKPIGEARAMLERLGAHSLPLARTSPAAEASLAYLTGAQPGVPRSSITLPAMALVTSDGREIGHHSGRMAPLPGGSHWFASPQAFELLMRMGKEF
ncbi:MAG: TlpA disulfide reductase family protein [Alphaproteobacteria bacterium]